MHVLEFAYMCAGARECACGSYRTSSCINTGSPIGLKFTIRLELLTSKPQESPYLRLHSTKVPRTESSHLLTE